MRTRSQVLFNPRRSVSPRPSAGSGSTASEDNRKATGKTPRNRKEKQERKETGKDAQKTDAPIGAAGQRMSVQRPTEMRISSWLMLAHARNPRPAIRRCTEIRGCCGSPGGHPRIVTTGLRCMADRMRSRAGFLRCCQRSEAPALARARFREAKTAQSRPPFPPCSRPGRRRG